MNDMGWFVFCKERLCRLRIAEKGPCVNQHGEIAEEKTRDGGVEVHLPKVGVTRASKNPGFIIAASEA